LDFGGRDLLVGEVLLEQCVVDVGDGFEQFVTASVGRGPQLGRDLDDLELRTFGVVGERPHDRPHLDEVEHPRKSLSTPIGNCTTAGVASSRSRIISTQRSKSAPIRSILFTKQNRGTSYLLA